MRPLSILLVSAIVISAQSVCLAKTVDLGSALGPAVNLYQAQVQQSPTLPNDYDEQLQALSETYHSLASTIQPGDSLSFSDGRRVIVAEFLGHGDSADVWRTNENLALRLPLHSYSGSNRTDLEDSLVAAELYLRGYEELIARVPRHTNKILASGGLEYQLVNLLTAQGDASNAPLILFDKFAMDPRHSGGEEFEFEGVSSETLIQGAYRLAAGLSGFSKLAEGIQAGWQVDRWVLFDWSEGNTVWEPSQGERTIFHRLIIPVYNERGQAIGGREEHPPFFEQAKRVALRARACRASLLTPPK
ncbi:MAG: hypothetical protein HRT45_07585 [Bdellovibrionales bacterium]|nr:hypothetical protein [Bdellovibrionales bacterium]